MLNMMQSAGGRYCFFDVQKKTRSCLDMDTMKRTGRFMVDSGGHIKGGSCIRQTHFEGGFLSRVAILPETRG